MAERKRAKRNMPKRAECPKCGKKGIGQWKANPYAAVPQSHRDCQYCGYYETRIVGH